MLNNWRGRGSLCNDVLVHNSGFQLSYRFNPVGLYFRPGKRDRYPAEGEREYWGGERDPRDGSEMGLRRFSLRLS